MAKRDFHLGDPLCSVTDDASMEKVVGTILEAEKLVKLPREVPGFHFSQPNSVAYFDIAPNVHVHSPGYPSRWHRFWQRVLLGWRWRRL